MKVLFLINSRANIMGFKLIKSVSVTVYYLLFISFSFCLNWMDDCNEFFIYICHKSLKDFIPIPEHDWITQPIPKILLSPEETSYSGLYVVLGFTRSSFECLGTI